MSRLVRSSLAVCLVLLSATALADPNPIAPDYPAVDAPAAVPDALAPWVPWVLDNQRERRCTRVSHRFVCDWPGTLRLALGESGARFALSVVLDDAADVALPGATGPAPVDVGLLARGGGAPTPLAVALDGDSPYVRLPAGAHTVVGQLRWQRTPEFVDVPQAIGFVEVRAADGGTRTPRREGRQVWLGAGGDAEANDPAGKDDDAPADRLRVRVHRRIEDGAPLRMTTRLQLDVSGRARRWNLGRVLVAGSRPTRLRSALPARLDEAGNLEVYARAGEHELFIDAVLPGAVDAIIAPDLGAGLGDPERFEAPETWVWKPDEAVRSVKLSGLSAIDPARTTLPSGWRDGSTWLANAGDTLQIATVRRGQPPPAPNRLRLRRTLWLDLDGEGWSMQDQLTGEMQRDWRLTYHAPATLGRVHDSQRGEDVLITRAPSSKDGVESAPGVAWRHRKVAIESEARLDEATSTLRATGWAVDADQLAADVRLPPGYRLLGADGVDEVPGAWLSLWELADIFFALLLALAVGKLIGWPWGGVALLAAVAIHGEFGAPVWAWMHLLAAVALLRVLPERGWAQWLGRLYHLGATVSLLAVVLPFVFSQIQLGVFPHVEHRSPVQMVTNLALGGGLAPMGAAADMQRADAVATEALKLEDDLEAEEEAAFGEAPAAALEMKAGGSGRGAMVRKMAKRKVRSKLANTYAQQAISSYDGSVVAQDKLQQLDPNAVVQTGAGLPTWSWRSWQLRWNGPVAQDHEMRLFLLGPMGNLLLALLRVLLVGLLAFRLLVAGSARDHAGRWLRRLRDGAQQGMALWLLVPAAALALSGGLALADTTLGGGAAFAQSAGGPLVLPSSELLESLERRLLERDRCDERGCVRVGAATLTLRGDELTWQARVDTRARGAALLPGTADVWRVAEVTVDGAPTQALRREEGGYLAVRLEPGVHTVRVRGRLGPRPSMALEVPGLYLPAHLSVDAVGWRVDGVSPDGVPETTLQLSRTAPSAAKPSAEKTGADSEPGAMAASALPPFFHVERTLSLGLPWRVLTRVERASSEDAAVLRLPLLDGEELTTAKVPLEKAADGARVAVLTFDAGQSVRQIESQLDVRGELALQAPGAATATNAAGNDTAGGDDGASPWPDLRWTETWRLDCSSVWRCEPEGIAPVARIEDGRIFPRYKPFPGESLKVAISRPTGVEGARQTIDEASVRFEPGDRLLQATLSFTLRASVSGRRVLTLPADAELQQVLVDGSEQTLALGQGGKLDLPVEPGTQRLVVRWRQPWQRGLSEQMPTVDMGGPAANVRICIARASSRWLLWASGPRWGPVVRFWAELAALLLFALVLGRVPMAGMSTARWIILAVGFTQMHPTALLVLAAWFIALTWRRTFEDDDIDRLGWWRFDLVQLGLAGLSAVALGTLYGAVHVNLLGDVDMQVSGAGSHADELCWIVDRIDAALPTVGTWSLPSWSWRALMLVWSLWLAWRLIGWISHAWKAWSKGAMLRKWGRPAAARDDSPEAK